MQGLLGTIWQFVSLFYASGFLKLAVQFTRVDFHASI